MILNELSNSFTENNIETDLKQLFLFIFDLFLSSKTSNVLVSANPQLGSVDFVKRYMSFYGITLVNSTLLEDDFKYILKSWTGKNNKVRGLGFLRTYLQVAYPNQVIINQLTQSKAVEYPLKTYYLNDTIDDNDKFLTSRVEFDLNNIVDFLSEKSIKNIIGSILPARFVPVFKSWRDITVDMFKVETLALDVSYKVSVNSTLKISELNPFRLLSESNLIPKYRLFNGVIIDSGQLLTVSKAGRLLLNGDWKIPSHKKPQFTLKFRV